MKELYRGFKKVSEDDQSAKLRHENGHELTIAKSGLNKNTLKMLQKLPLYEAEGTLKAEDPGTEIGNGQAAEDLQKEMEAAKSGKPMSEEPQYSGTKYEPKPEAPMPSIDVNSPEFQKLAQSWGGAENVPQNVIDDLVQRGAPGFGSSSVAGSNVEQKINQLNTQMQQAGIGAQPPVPQQEPRAVAAQPQVVAKPMAPAKPRTPEEILSDPNASVADQYQAHVQMSNRYNQQMLEEDKRFEDAMKNDEINPNRIYANQEFPQKVSTIIGLMLGGIGAGLTGGENVVQKMLDNQVRMDVEEQKRQSDKKLNLYKIHLERLGNARDAELATANNLKQAALVKMEQAAGLLGGNPAAQTRIQNQILGQKLELETNRTKLAQAKAQRDAVSLAQKTGGELPDIYDPRKEQAVRVLLPGAKTPKKLYARIPGEAAKLQTKAAGLMDAKQALNEMGQALTESAGRIRWTDARKQLNAISARALLALGQAADISPKLMDELENLIGKPDLFQSKDEAEIKRREALKMIDQMTKTLQETSLTN